MNDDGQIPEGIYGIGYLNPNSSYYFSLKVTYPNASDRARAKADGRTNLGGDIMIHGQAVTIGCVPVGDDAIDYRMAQFRALRRGGGMVELSQL